MLDFLSCFVMYFDEHFAWTCVACIESPVMCPSAMPSVPSFSVSGTSIALDAQMPAFTATMMGVITGVFGGVLRDVLCNEIPLILRDSRPYAVCAFAGCWIYLGLERLDVDTIYNVLISTAFILIARLITFKFDIRLPH